MTLTSSGRYATGLVREVNEQLAEFGLAPASAALVEATRDAIVERAEQGHLLLYGWLGKSRLAVNRPLGTLWAASQDGMFGTIRESRLHEYLLLRIEADVADLDWAPTIARSLAGVAPAICLPENTPVRLLRVEQVCGQRRADLRIKPIPART